MHDIDLRLPEALDEDNEISFSASNVQNELLDLFHKFTRIPRADMVLPFICAYEMLPLPGLRQIPFLFCTGSSGSGKSTVGEILQRLNPRGFDNCAGLTASDTYKGWEQSLPLFRSYPNGKERAFPMLTIDDLEPRIFNGDIGALKLNFFKQIVTANGAFSRGSAEGAVLTIKAFTKLCTGSIHDLPTLEGLQELERRVIRIETKNVKHWTEEDFCAQNRGVEMLNHWDYSISNFYDEMRYRFINSIAGEMLNDRTECKKRLRSDFVDLIPQNRRDFYAPVIAMRKTLYGGSIERAVEDFTTLFVKPQTKDAETSLTKLVRAWLDCPSNPWASRERLWIKSGFSYQIKFSEVYKFLRHKIQDGELSVRSCSRENVISTMSTLAFRIGSEGTDTIFFKPDNTEVDDE